MNQRFLVYQRLVTCSDEPKDVIETKDAIEKSVGYRFVSENGTILFGCGVIE